MQRIAEQTPPLRYSQIHSFSRNRSKQSHSLHKSGSPVTGTNDRQLQVHPNLAQTLSKMAEKIQNMEVKINSLTSVVKLFQKYTETKDHQYEKQKQNETFRKSIGDRVGSIQSLQIENKIREFDILSRQMKNELKTIDKIKSDALLDIKSSLKQFDSPKITNLNEIEDRLREELNLKIDSTMKFISRLSSNDTSLHDKVNEVVFEMNRVENNCLRNHMLLQKEFQSAKEKSAFPQSSSNRTPITKNSANHNQNNRNEAKVSNNNHSHEVTKFGNQAINQKDVNSTVHVNHWLNRTKGDSVVRSKSKSRSKSISASHRSIEEYSQNKIRRKVQAVTPVIENSRKIKDEELREAIRRKKENKEKLQKSNW